MADAMPILQDTAVPVIAAFYPGGEIHPLSMTWQGRLVQAGPIRASRRIGSRLDYPVSYGGEICRLTLDLETMTWTFSPRPWATPFGIAPDPEGRHDEMKAARDRRVARIAEGVEVS